ncbi:uncharacterized protein M6B38_283580 [Iris pallida]|uniref:O-fucosyltransferase family protein n=1 Tax=Iris pallida TaxID=29817 RepID=A0AAX6I0S9_IRIPA|nr:uncharacterized protein M6B38_283580 [Iris pallida]
MDLSVNRSRWRRRAQTSKPLFLLSISIVLFSLFLVLSLSSYRPFLNPKTLIPKSTQCRPQTLTLDPSERFLWYAPHSGFSNQLAELRNALLLSAILNRTLIVPPVLDHHSVALGSCPKFRVTGPSELRAAVWDHIMQLADERRYVSMADIVDLSSVASMVKLIDFRVFASVWCGLNMEKACYGSLCCAISGIGSLPSNTNQCRSMLSGMHGNSNSCVYALEEDCRTTVWTYQQDDDAILDAFQPDEELRRKKKISYVRKRRDIYKAFGPGSIADGAAILVFGSLFSSPYKGSELYIDIHQAPRDLRIQSLLRKIEFLPFAPEIISAGEKFSVNKIKESYLCAQLRLLDGQFKNHWKATFAALEQKIKLLQLELKEKKVHGPLHIFIMTDLPTANWTGTYLADLAKDVNSYKFYTLQDSDELVIQTAKKLMAAEHGLRSGFLPKNLDVNWNRVCDPVLLPDVLLYIEETICSCASMGFVGTAGSTIAESIELIIKNNICKL